MPIPWKNLLAVLLPLVLGIFFYLFFREKQPFGLLQPSAPFSPLSSGFQQSLPNGLWSFSLTILLLLIWKNDGRIARLFCVLTVMLSAAFFEWLQHAGLASGTFDGSDVVFSCAGSLLATLIFLKFIHHA